jgi:hypothetical protein
MLPVSAEGPRSTIAEWLMALGMSQYTERVTENGIDVSVLPELTKQDFEKLGVLLGHRRKMLRAIHDFGSAAVAVTAPPALMAGEPTRQDGAEYRQSERDVLRPRWLDCAPAQARPRGYAQRLYG